MVIDGRAIAKNILNDVANQVAELSFQPVFCDVLVGEDPASVQYVEMKANTAEQVGLKFRRANFPESITTEQLIREIKSISGEPNMCGLIVQLPLPAHIDRQAVLNAIDSKIDVDCIGQTNSDLFYSGRAYMEFPTAAAVMEILKQISIDYKKQDFLVIGQGQLVGKPVSFLLKQRGCKIDVATSATKNTDELIKNADVIISAAGQPNLITGDKIKVGAIIIDAGTSEADSGIVGDVDFESVHDKASFVSPVPGGVGPVTVAMLFRNVLKVAKLKN